MKGLKIVKYKNEYAVEKRTWWGGRCWASVYSDNVWHCSKHEALQYCFNPDLSKIIRIREKYMLLAQANKEKFDPQVVSEVDVLLRDNKTVDKP